MNYGNNHATHLFDKFTSGVLRYGSCELFQQCTRKRFNEVEMEGFIEILLEVLCYPFDVGKRWRHKVDSRNIR